MKKQNRLLSLILSLFLLLFTLVPQSALTVKAEGNSEMAVHFIDVGQGNAILVQSGQILRTEKRSPNDSFF